MRHTYSGFYLWVLSLGFNCHSQRYLCQSVKGKAKRLRRSKRYKSFVLAHNLSFGLPLVCGREHFVVIIDVEKRKYWFTVLCYNIWFYFIFIFAITYVVSCWLCNTMSRRKHSELVGELSNLYHKEQKLLSEVCMLVLFSVVQCRIGCFCNCISAV